MIIYIHGFGSHGYGSKARAFRKFFKKENIPFIAPSLSYVPELAIQTLEELIESYDNVKLIGSSLGGYYTMYLAQKYKLKCVLINPAMYPYKTLQRAIPKAPNFYDGSFYGWGETHLEMLKKFSVTPSHQNNIMLMLQKGDDVLDYKEALEKLPNASLVLKEGGSHSFDGIERYFDQIEAFLLEDIYKHTSTVKGVPFANDVLAKRIGDLYYDSLAEFLMALSEKLVLDGDADAARGRRRLAQHLHKASKYIAEASVHMDGAWEVCKAPTMQWLSKNGFNREPDFIEVYKIPDEKRDFYGWDSLREIYGHKRFLPYIKEMKNSYADVLEEKLKQDGWEITPYDIRPNLPSKAMGDTDVYYRHYRLTRYVASKGNRHFYFDEEICTDDASVWVHYGEDCKEMVKEL